LYPGTTWESIRGMDPTDRPTYSGKPTYPEASARRMMGDLTSREPDKFRDRRANAAQRLLKQLVALFKEHGYECDPSTAEHARIHLRHGLVDVFVEGGAISLDVGGGRRIPPLVFNPTTQLLESTEQDPEVVPVPGELLPRRSALAELVHMLLRREQ
jgi:hypothetical protein